MRIAVWKRFSYALCLVTAAAVSGGLYAVTAHAGPSVRTVDLRDDCDPTSFNQVVGPGTCVGDGDTTFDELTNELVATGSVQKWRFNPERTEADRGVNTVNRGGETHTFTEVARFGGGFVPPLNVGRSDLAPECATSPGVPAAAALSSIVPAGTSSSTVPLTKGVHKFQCCIHPWMQTTIVIK
jgi:hypothetical protein